MPRQNNELPGGCSAVITRVRLTGNSAARLVKIADAYGMIGRVEGDEAFGCAVAAAGGSMDWKNLAPKTPEKPELSRTAGRELNLSEQAPSPSPQISPDSMGETEQTEPFSLTGTPEFQAADQFLKGTFYQGWDAGGTKDWQDAVHAHMDKANPIYKRNVINGLKAVTGALDSTGLREMFEVEFPRVGDIKTWMQSDLDNLLNGHSL